MNSKNPEMHDCECGFLWRHGQSGDHSCGPYFRQTIAELRAAAAPQVVSDERVAQTPVAYMAFAENGNIRVWAEKDNLGAKETSEKMGCKLMPVYAAPVQAQEPVFKEVGSFLYIGVEYVATSSDDPRGIKLYRPTVAPVQPVAVPDGWRDAALESAVQAVAERAGKWQTIAAINAFDAIRSLKKNRHALPESCSSLAAPAAQGDAETARQAAFKEAIEACYKTVADRAKVRHIGDAAHYSACADAIRAIAAKAAS